LARPNLPWHNLPLRGGLNTYFNPESTAGRSLSIAKNVDSFEEFQSIGKVPGSTRQSADHSSALLGLWYYEYLDIDRVRKRKTISHASTNLATFTTSAVTNFTAPTGATLKATTLDAVIANERIHFTGVGQNTMRTGGLQYDGSNLRNWGIQPPGATETVWASELAMDDFSQWTDSAEAGSADATFSIDGGGSVSVAKDVGSAKECSIAITISSIDIGAAAGQDTAFIYLFVPFGGLQNLENDVTLTGKNAAVFVQMGITSYTTNGIWTFNIGELVPGWNLLSMDLDNPDADTSFDKSAVTDITLGLVATTTGTTWTGAGNLFAWDFGHTVDEGALSGTAGPSGLPDGEYTYRVTFLTESGVESNAGPASANVSLSLEKGDLSAIPVSTDEQVIARRIYRDISADGVFRFVTQIDDNLLTTFVENVADSALGSAQPPLAADAFIDNSPSPVMLAVSKHENRILGIDDVNRVTLHLSDVALPNAFRIVDQLTFEEELVALKTHTYGTLIYGTDKIFLMLGNGISTAIRIEEATAEAGANGFRAVEKVKGHNVVSHEDRVFLVANPADPWLLNGPILDKFQALTKADLDEMVVVHDRSRYRIIFFPKAADEALVWQYGTSGAQEISGLGSGIDPLEIRNGQWYTLNFETDLDVLCAAMTEDTDDTPELWVGSSDGYVYQLQDTTSTGWAKQELAKTAVASVLEFEGVPMGRTPDGRGVPRGITLGAKCDSATTFTIDLTLLTGPSGATVDSLSFSITAPAGESNAWYPVPALRGRGQWCRVKISESSTAEKWVIRSVRLHYLARKATTSGPRAT
jgi:hypothetical protein